MSNIYIQEPQTFGKVLLKTTVGDIDVELWSKECPRACRNFIQLCLEGYYDGTIFHRVVKNFIVQGGDPTGDGTGGESIYDGPFKDEFHSRIRYTRRGLVGMANSGNDDNGSQFFFTMAATPELQNKNTLFGKVTGDTIYNMLKLEEGMVDHNERPMYPQKILYTEVLSNPFKDIKPRLFKIVEEKKNNERIEGVKNFGLLSFGTEAKEDEEETNQFVRKNSRRAKSMHDLGDDPQMSKDILKIESKNCLNEARLPDSGVILENDVENGNVEESLKRIRDKLQVKLSGSFKKGFHENLESTDSEDDVLITQEEHKRKYLEKKKNEIRKEITSLKKEYQKNKISRCETAEENTEAGNELMKNSKNNIFIKNFIEEKEKYRGLKSKIPNKGHNREEFTLSLLSKFRLKLNSLKEKELNGDKYVVDNSTVEKEIQCDSWLAHRLKFQEETPILAKDASTKTDDWYDAYDPRNPINKRKRGDIADRTSSYELSFKRKK